MTEAEWLACDNVRKVLESLKRKATFRKVRLFAVSCCRCIWASLDDERSRAAVETVERLADRRCKPDVYLEAHRAAKVAMEELDNVTTGTAELNMRRRFRSAAYHASWPLKRNDASWVYAHLVAHDIRRYRESDSEQCVFLRDIFGNPFRPVAFAPEWRTDTAVAIASQMYASRDFSAMPILADALQDAGCDHATILAHCLDPKQVHVRGCWVVDLVLGKK